MNTKQSTTMMHRYNLASRLPIRVPLQMVIAIGALCFLILTSDTASAQGEWKIVSPTGLTGATNIYFLDEMTGFALGFSSGTSRILKTTDGGTKWSGQPWGNSLLFGQAHSTDSTIYVTGHWPQCTCAVIMRSPDRGRGWWLDTIESSFGFYDISFPTPRIGYTGGYNGTILKTTDNGETWERLNTPNYTDVFTDIVFTSSETGYALAGPNGAFYNTVLLYRTLDGGLTWQLLADYNGVLNIFDMAWPDEQTGLMLAGSEGASLILRSDDGGETWDEIELNTNGRLLLSISFADDRTGYAVGQEGLILRTTDGGLTWIEEGSPTGDDLSDVHAVGSLVTAISTGSTLIKRVEESSGVGEERRDIATNTAEVTLLPLPLTSRSQLVLRNLPANVDYTFALYDQLGREVVRVDGIRPEVPAGIERGNLADGMYLYRIISSDMKVVAGGGIVVH